MEYFMGSLIGGTLIVGFQEIIKLIENRNTHRILRPRPQCKPRKDKND